MCSNSMACAQVILKQIRQRLWVAVSQKEKMVTHDSKSYLLLVVVVVVRHAFLAIIQMPAVLASLNRHGHAGLQLLCYCDNDLHATCFLWPD